MRISIAGAALATCIFAAGQNLSFGERKARHDPAWMNQINIYEVWLNAFSAEGTVRGAIPRLRYLADLGVKVVYLGPIAKRATAVPNASPYNIADYNAIDPQYGNEQDLRDFVTAAHKLGLKVMLDIVYYHTAPDSVLSFLRRGSGEEILVIVNLSNRKVHVTIDLPVMDYYSVENLLKNGKTWFELYSGRVSATLGAYENVVGKRVPLAPLAGQ